MLAKENIVTYFKNGVTVRDERCDQILHAKGSSPTKFFNISKRVIGTLSIKSTAIFFSLAVAPRPQQIINYKLTQKTQFTGRHKNLRMGNVVRGPLIFIQSIRKRTEIKLLK